MSLYSIGTVTAAVRVKMRWRGMHSTAVIVVLAPGSTWPDVQICPQTARALDPFCTAAVKTFATV